MINWLRNLTLRRTGAKRKQRGKYLYKLIWIGCVSVCIPIILASVVYYQFSMDRVKQQMLNESGASLMMMKDRAERILQGIEQESLQLAIDPVIKDFFANGIVENSMDWHRQVLDRIALSKNSNNVIDDIYFYNKVEDVVLSNRYGVIPKRWFKYKEEIDRIFSNGRLSQWAFMPVSQQDGLITFARMLPLNGSSSPQGVLAFEIDIRGVSKFMQSDTLFLPFDHELLILNDPNLKEIKGIDKEHLHALLANLPAIQTIRTSGKSSDSFFAESIDGEKAQFLYSKNIFGRTYIMIVPEQFMERQLNWIRAATLIVLLSLVVLGILLTYFNTKRAYNPVEELIKHSTALSLGRVQSKENELDFIKECLDFLNKESEKLSNYMEKIEPTLREKCLQQLLGWGYVRSDVLLRDCEAYGISVRATNAVLVVEAENIKKDKRFIPHEKGIIAFVIANVMQEMLDRDETLQGFVLPYQGRGVAVLQYHQDKELEVLLQQTLLYAHSVCASLKDALSIDVSIGVGRLYSHVADIPVSYQEAESALHSRLYIDSDRVLFIEDLEQVKKQSALRYPKHLEYLILDSLEKGDIQSSADYLSDFADLLRNSESYVYTYQSYHLLLSSIIHSLEEQGGDVTEIVDHHLFEQLQDKQISKDIYDWFVETLFPLYKWLTENYRNEGGQTIIQKVRKHIKEQCGGDVSLVQCADAVGISPSYLSHLFKKETGMNFLEYVIECKVEMAKKLLTDTEQSVSDIASAIGYSERNLNRMFQRLTKMSPSAFRSKYR